MTLLPFDIGFWVVFVGCTLAAAAALLVVRQRLPRKLQRFQGREKLSIGQIHERFYPRADVTFLAELWGEIASATEVPAGLIRPTDRFDQELAPVKGFEIVSKIEELQEVFTRRCKDCQIDYRNARIETVDDYIRLFSTTAPETE